jgi:uncharacterized protein YjbJ (UPF0337 family)
MSEQQVNGAIEQGKGRLKEAVGALTGDLKTQAAGKAEELRGQAEALYGDAVDKLSAFAQERPAAALASALGLGIVIGLFLGRN